MLVNLGHLKKISEEVLWDLPETRSIGGNVAILIGNSEGFRHSSFAYESAFDTTNISPRVLLPKSISSIAAALPREQVYIYESNKRSAISTQSLASLRAADSWADALLLPAGMGRNSETTLLLSKFLADSFSPLILGGESANLALIDTWVLKRRASSVLVTSFGNLQKASVRNDDYPPLVASEPLIATEQKLAEIARLSGAAIVTERTGRLILADPSGNSCSIAIRTESSPSVWQPKIAGRIAALASKATVNLSLLQTASYLHIKPKG